MIGDLGSRNPIGFRKLRAKGLRKARHRLEVPRALVIEPMPKLLGTKAGLAHGQNGLRQLLLREANKIPATLEIGSGWSESLGALCHGLSVSSAAGPLHEIGRASCREGVETWVG